MDVEKHREPVRLVILILIFLSPALAYLMVPFSGGNTLLFEDGLLQSFPLRVFLRNAFENGFSSQWMPSSALGFSLLAEGQNGICFPGTQIIYKMFSAEVGWIIEIILGHLVAFIFCYRFLQHLRVSRFSSLYGASVYAFCMESFLATAIPALIWSHALLPGIFLSCDLFIEKRPFSFFYLVIIFTLVFLIGHPVLMIYIGMMISVYLIVPMMNGWPREKTIREIMPRFLALFGTVLIAALIASPQLLPILHQLPFSARTVGGGISLDDLQNTLHFLPIWFPKSLFPTPQPLGGTEYFLNVIRFPFFSLFLGFIGVVFGARGPRRGYFIFLCVFSILMGLGPYIGLWKIVHSLPGLKYLRYPIRWGLFLPICVSLFSARGVDHLINLLTGLQPDRLRRVLKSILIMGFATGVVFLILYHNKILRHTQKTLEFSPWLTVLLWLCTIGMVLAVFLSLTKGATRRGVMLGIALSVISLFASIAMHILDPLVIRNLGMIGWKADISPTEPQAYRTSSAMDPWQVLNKGTMFRHYYYTPNLTILNGTLSTGYYLSFIPYWSANLAAWSQKALRGDHSKQIYLDLSSARWLFLPDGSFAEKVGFPTASFKGMKAYENPRAMSRASVVFSRRIFPGEGDLIAFLESSDFDPRRDVAILRQDAEAWDLRSDVNKLKTATIPHEATIVVDRPDRIEIELKPVPSMGGAYLVFSDTYYPGWRALVDGVETKVLRANYAFRGIKLPEGAKHVVFFYDPLVPDAVLPLPTILLASLGGVMCLRHFLIKKHDEGMTLKKPA